MTTFRYAYLTPSGRARKGTIDADTLQEAKNQLRQKRVMVTSIQSKTHLQRKSYFRKQTLLNFTLQLSQLIDAGLPIFESLSAIEEEWRTQSFHPILLSLCRAIEKGDSLSLAMGKHPKSFSPLYRAMIAAGEASGSLSLVLKRLATLLSRELKLKHQLISSLAYPALLACFCIVVIVLLLTFAIPSIETLFEGRTLSPLTAIIFGLSHFLKHFGFLLPLLFLPLLKWRPELPFTRIASLSRFLRTLATLQEGGLNTIDALTFSREVVTHPALKAHLEKAEKHIIAGSSLSQELREEKLIPPLVPRMLRVGEKSGDVTPMLQQIADHYDQDLEKKLTRLTTLAQPIILIVMGGIIGLVMLAVLLPLTDVTSLM